MKKLLLVLLAFCTIMCIAAEVTITKVQQRYPWNGLVDIECNVTGLTNALDNRCFSVSVDILNTTNTIEATNFFVLETKENIQNFIVSTNGTYNLVWNTIADLGKVNSSDVILDITLESLHKGVQLWADGPYWAETNIGADNPEDYGYYFWWGDTIGYKRENNKWVASDGSSSDFSFTSSNIPTYDKVKATLQSEGWITSNGVLAPSHDAACAHWGSNWRMPTDSELDALCDNCTWTWTTTNGVKGYIVSGKGVYSGASIFLPAAGYGKGASLGEAGSYGYYWSPVWHSGYNFDSSFLYFYSSDHYRAISFRLSYGHPVRPVSDVH